MRRILLSSVVYLAVPYFSTFSHKKILNTKCVFISCTTFYFLYNFLFPVQLFPEKCSHFKKNSAIFYLMYLSFHVKSRYYCQILNNIEFVGGFSKNPQIKNFMKIPAVVSCGQTDRWTDRYDEANLGRFSQYLRKRLKTLNRQFTCHKVT